MLEQRRVVTATPENSETPLENVRSWVTPNRLFFVRNHFGTPELEVESWRLSVAGLVKQPKTWTWDELTALPERTVFATVECAGNGRSFLAERVHGVQWGAGAIGHAEWTGVPLRLVLDKAEMLPGAVEVLFEGCDQGSESDHPEPMHFQRSLPLEKALHADTLLVYRMNGELLDPIHGFPLRLFVPGWYGVASVKWLSSITVLDRPFKGYYQTKKYTIERESHGRRETVVIGPMAVKSEIVRPQAGETLGLGTNRIFGVAWAGEEAVTRVEVSTDGGKTWSCAELIGPRAAYSWTMWEYLWEIGEPGEYSIMARAVAASGKTQPDDYDPLLGGYLISFVRPTPVRVQGTSRSTARGGDWDSIVYDMNAFAEENVRHRLDVEMEFSGGEGI